MARTKPLLIFLAVMIFLPAFSCLPADRVFASTDKIERIFYYADYKKAKAIESVKNNADKIDILAPQSYAISFNLKVSGKLDSDLKKIISEHKLKVMPLVVNAGFNQALMHKILVASSASQGKIIKFLVDEAVANKYIGWQFDFENISYKDKDLYTAFIKKTASALKKKKLILSVAAVVRTDDNTDTDAYRNWGGAFDYEKIASAADFISIMAYDDPESKGPTASVPFVQEVLNYMKDKIPAEKLSLGIPLYYWGWSVDPLKRVVAGGSYASLLSVMQRFTYQIGFDEELGVSWVDYFYNNKEYKIWYEDNQSFAIKLGIAKGNNLRGFSAWVLGSENPAIWWEL
jgi:spore germination protein YaaH